MIAVSSISITRGQMTKTYPVAGGYEDIDEKKSYTVIFHRDGYYEDFCVSFRENPTPPMEAPRG